MYRPEPVVPDAKTVPQPTGFRLLVAIPDLEEKTKGGIILPDKLIDLEKTASIVGFVLKMGPDAYKDEAKFPSGPWCKEGDFVLFRSYSGTRFVLGGKHEFRIINDDTVECVIDDPRQIRRAAS